MILVTGGTGLVGAHLLYYLTLEHASVRATRRRTSNVEPVKTIFKSYTENYHALFDKIEWVEADITDICALDIAFMGITQVYHSAALISFNPKDYLKMRKINIEGTSNIVNFCIIKKVEKLCFVSSIASIDKNSKHEQIDENQEWNHESNNYGYAITKYGAEMEVWRASQEGVPVVIVNPGVILGSGIWDQGSGKIFSKVFKGMPFYTNGITGYVSVKDVVSAMLLLMKSPIENERFILVAENLSFKFVFSKIAVSFGKNPPRIRVRQWMSELGWRLGVLKSLFTNRAPLLTRHSAKSIHNCYSYTSNKIEEKLQFKFHSIEKEIPKICKEYLKSK